MIDQLGHLLIQKEKVHLIPVFYNERTAEKALLDLEKLYRAGLGGGKMETLSITQSLLIA